MDVVVINSRRCEEVEKELFQAAVTAGMGSMMLGSVHVMVTRCVICFLPSRNNSSALYLILIHQIIYWILQVINQMMSDKSGGSYYGDLHITGSECAAVRALNEITEASFF